MFFDQRVLSAIIIVIIAQQNEIRSVRQPGRREKALLKGAVGKAASALIRPLFQTAPFAKGFPAAALPYALYSKKHTNKQNTSISVSGPDVTMVIRTWLHPGSPRHRESLTWVEQRARETMLSPRQYTRIRELMIIRRCQGYAAAR